MATTYDVIIAHMISVDAQRYRHGKHKVILGPAGRIQSAQPAGKNACLLTTTAVNGHDQSLRLPDTISMEPFQQYLAETFPGDGKRSTSGAVQELDSTVNAC